MGTLWDDSLEVGDLAGEYFETDFGEGWEMGGFIVKSNEIGFGINGENIKVQYKF